MIKKFSFGAVIALMAVTAAITISITYTVAMKVFNERVYSVTERQTMYDKLSEIDQKVRQNYYGDINEDELRTALSEGYLNGIGDGYGKYLTAAEYKADLERQSGKAYSIGIDTDRSFDGNILVYNVYENSPAAQSGIKPGDVITRVENASVASMGYDKALMQLNSVSTSKSVFTVNRSGAVLEFEIEKYKYDFVDVTSRAIGKVGYIYIKQFEENTCEQFENAISDLVGQGCTGFVFDVRGNSGGQLSAVCDVLDVLLPAGNLVYTTDKNGVTSVAEISDAKEFNLPSIVLVNDETASAAELFAAALRDRKNAKLVGANTVGKGTLQKTFPLSDGSAIVITVATFSPPVSECFDGVGLTPDFSVQLADKESNFHLLDEENDNQLSTAISVLSYNLPQDDGEAQISADNGEEESSVTTDEQADENN